MPLNSALIISVDIISVDNEGFGCGGHYVYLGHALIGYRPYDGKDTEKVLREVEGALVEVLREKLGWPLSPDEGL